MELSFPLKCKYTESRVQHAPGIFSLYAPPLSEKRRRCVSLYLLSSSCSSSTPAPRARSSRLRLRTHGCLQMLTRAVRQCSVKTKNPATSRPSPSAGTIWALFRTERIGCCPRTFNCTFTYLLASQLVPLGRRNQSIVQIEENRCNFRGSDLRTSYPACHLFTFTSIQ